MRFSFSRVFLQGIVVVICLKVILVTSSQGRNRVHIITNHISEESSLEEINSSDSDDEVGPALDAPQMIPIVVNTWAFSAAAEQGTKTKMHVYE